MGLLPAQRPFHTAAQINSLIAHIDRKKFPVLIVGLRGDFLSMGNAGVNDRGIYDDAIAIVSPSGIVWFNGNTDPGAYRKGKGFGSGKGMAVLKCGDWDYQLGLHKGEYLAFVQAAAVTVIRDGVNGDYEDTGWHGINIHHGGPTKVSSIGCQTIPIQQGQWDAFIALARAEMKRHGVKKVKYVLREAVILDRPA